MLNKFIKAIEDEGIKPPAEIIADGEIHLFDSTNGRQTWSGPKPLPDAPPPPPPLDPEILPQPFADFAKATALENEVSPEAGAAFLYLQLGQLQVLVFVSNLIQEKKVGMSSRYDPPHLL